MATKISGTVEDENGNLLDGATVYVIRESDDSIVATVSSDSAGEFEVTGLNDSETYHVGAQYDDGSTKYAGESYPFVEPFIDTGPIDDFEDNEIVEYQGDKVSYNVQSSNVYEGSYALGMSNDDNSVHAINSQSGLPRYPAQGDAFSFRCYIEPGGIAEMMFGYSDSDNHYRARISERNGGITLMRIDGGMRTDLDSDAQSIPSGEWLEGVVDWGNPDNNNPISFTLYDASGTQVAKVSSEDNTFTSGGIGWRSIVDDFSGNSIYYDILELTTAGTTPTDLIDDWEDGDTVTAASNWDGWSTSVTGSNISHTAQTGTVLSGTYSGEFNVDGDSVNIHTTRDVRNEIQKIDCLIRIDKIPSNRAFLFTRDSSGNRIIDVSFEGDGTVEDVNNNQIGTFSADTTYKVVVDNIDYTNRTCDIEVVRVSDDNTVASGTGISFHMDADSNIKDLGFHIDSRTSQNQTIWVDDVGALAGDDVPLQDELVDDFEDGNKTVAASNWSGWSFNASGSFNVTSGINGSYSAELSGNDSEIPQITATRDSAGQANKAQWWFRASNRNGFDDDRMTHILCNGAGDRFARVYFEQNGDLEIPDGNKVGTWSTGTDYKVIFYNIDWSAETYDARVEDASGNVIGSNTGNPFQVSSSGVGEIECFLDNNDGHGTSVTAYWDDFELVGL